MGVRSVDDNEVVFAGLMDTPNDQAYNIACQTKQEDDEYWSSVVTGTMDSHVGAATQIELEPDEAYNYQCWLRWDFDAFGPNGRKLPEQAIQTLDGTSDGAHENRRYHLRSDSNHHRHARQHGRHKQ